MNLIAMVSQSGIFRWRDLSAPPSGVESLIGAEGGELLVKSKEGTTYSILVDIFDCEQGNQDPECFVWKPIDASLAEEIPEISSRAQKRTDCETLQPGIFPLNPSGQVVECVHSFSFSFGVSGYFALMISGEVFYVNGYFPETFISREVFRFSINFTVFVAIIISVVYALLLVILWVVTRLAEVFFSHSSRHPFTVSEEYLIFSHYVFPVIAVLIIIFLMYILMNIRLTWA